MWASFLALATGIGGCARSASPPQSEQNGVATKSDVDAAPTPAHPNLTPQPTSSGIADLPASETWQVHYFGDAKVGYGRMKVAPHGNGLVRIESEEELTMDRGGSTVTQKVTLVSIEKPGGELVRFESRVNFGPVATISRGEVTGGAELQIETETAGRTAATTLPWRPEWQGFFAVEQSLRRHPMEPGQTRTLHALQPILNQVGEVRLTAREFEDTPLLLGTRRLLRIDGELPMGDIRLKVTFWTDEDGETWKSFTPLTPQVQQTTYRATRELALSQDQPARFDLFENITVQIAKPLEKGHDSRRVVYRGTLKEGDPMEAFISDTAQAVERIDDHTAKITVQAVRPDQPPQPANDVSPPTAQDSQPSSLIQSDDPRVVAMARSVAPQETEPWKIAVALESAVKDAITEKNFSQAFATAAEVAESREGDCTEHAVLLAALCRARDIPARCAMGLVYFPQPSGAAFAYHMWTEVWINDRWIPLDGTLGRGGVGGGHLKVAHSNLAGAAPYAAFLPVFRVLGQLELEVLEEE